MYLIWFYHRRHLLSVSDRDFVFKIKKIICTIIYENDDQVRDHHQSVEHFFESLLRVRWYDRCGAIIKMYNNVMIAIDREVFVFMKWNVVYILNVLVTRKLRRFIRWGWYIVYTNHNQNDRIKRSSSFHFKNFLSF